MASARDSQRLRVSDPAVFLLVVSVFGYGFEHCACRSILHGVNRGQHSMRSRMAR